MIDLEAARTCYQKTAKGGETLAQHRLFWAYRNGTLGLKTDPEAARMWFEKAVNHDSEDEDEEEDKLARLLRKLQVGCDFSMGAVGVATVVGFDRGPSPRGGGARIVTIGLQSNVPLGTAI